MAVTDPRTGDQVILEKSGEYYEEVVALSSCIHLETELRCWTNRNGSTAAVEQCLACGERRGNPVGGLDHRTLPRADEGLAVAWRESVAAQKRDLLIRYIDEQRESDGGWWASYNAYLQTPEWKHRRELVLKRCGYVCEGCGEAEAVEVHHMSYEHVFEEFLFELKGLCSTCHQRWHDSEGRK